MFDPRAIANFVLDLATTEQIQMTNLSLNKVVYFVHALYLSETGKPLVDAKIEAWQYGPVFREIYHEFKACGERAIDRRAKCFNAESGEYEQASLALEYDKLARLSELALPYIRMRPFDLVELSHENGGPWHKAWAYSGDINPGMEITNDSITSYFSEQARH